MTDREDFQKTFDKLHASPEVLTEVLKMSEKEKIVHLNKKRFMPKAAAAVAALALIVGTGGAAYAADLGGIQRTVQLWIHGDQTNATFTVENGSYTLTYTDENGEEHEQSGGGVAYDWLGRERDLTPEEMLEDLNDPEVFFEEDGSVYLCYMDQKMDLTDKFEDGFCFVTLEVEGETQYITVKKDGGYAMSPKGYVQPKEFEVR